MRWSNANPAGTYRLQPFGGRMLETNVFQGFRIPTRVELGNQWGRPDYAPFLRATIRQTVYGLQAGALMPDGLQLRPAPDRP